MRKAPFLTCSERTEVSPRVAQTDRRVRSASNVVGVMVILAIVLPEADRAEVEPAAPGKGKEAAARAGVRAALWSSNHVPERHGPSVAPERIAAARAALIGHHSFVVATKSTVTTERAGRKVTGRAVEF